MHRTLFFVSCCVLLLAASASEACRETPQRFQWPSFRGPQASGIADGQSPPIQWDVETGQNVLWKVPIPGLGHSSPVVWDDRIFLTTAISEDPESIFLPGLDGMIDRRTDRSRHEWRVYGIDRGSGQVVWMHQPVSGSPSIQRHPKNSYASATPATDGEHVVVLLSTGGLFCYDFDGEPLWEVDLGPLNAGASYDVTYQWAAGSSPIIWEDLVIVQADQQEGSFIAAFDVDTGEEAWRTPRDVISSYSTPTIHHGADRVELVTSGAEKFRGYDPRTGQELWKLSSRPIDAPPSRSDPFTWATVATPVSADGLLFVSSVFLHAQVIFAVREGAVGDISLASGESSSWHVAWRAPRDGPYLTTPLAYRGFLYVISGGGVLNIFETGTGKRVQQIRVGGVASAYSASPVAADGRLYVTNEDGDIFVVQAWPDYELLATNRMGEVTLATPAISEGQIFIRTRRHLFALQDGVSSDLH
jgi:outer membrane protein assembly factor BamB